MSLDELRALEQAATPGPWAYDFDPSGFFVLPADGDEAAVVCSMDDVERDAANAQLIVAARNALPGLLDRVAAVEAERDALRTALEDVRPLVAACLAEFTSAVTEGLVESDGGYEPDESEVALPSSHITFGVIRRARRAFAASASGVAEPTTKETR